MTLSGHSVTGKWYLPSPGLSFCTTTTGVIHADATAYCTFGGASRNTGGESFDVRMKLLNSFDEKKLDIAPSGLLRTF